MNVLTPSVDGRLAIGVLIARYECITYQRSAEVGGREVGTWMATWLGVISTIGAHSQGIEPRIWQRPNFSAWHASLDACRRRGALQYVASGFS